MKPVLSSEAGGDAAPAEARPVGRFLALISRLTGADPNGVLFRRIASGFFGTAGLRMATMLLAFVTTSLLARFLGPAAFGVYAFAMAMVNILSVLTELGLATLVLREVAKYRARGEWNLMRGVILRANQITFAIVLLFGAGLAAWLLLWPDAGEHKIGVTVIIAFALIPIVSLGRIRASVLQGLGHVLQGQLPERLIRPGVFFLATGIALLTVGLQPWSAMALNVLSALIAFIVGYWLLVRCFPTEMRGIQASYDTKAWLRSLLPFALIGGVGVINAEADLIFLGFYRDSSDVGVYRAAFLIALQVPLAVSFMDVVLAPHFSALFHGGELDRLRRITHRSVYASMVFSVPFAAICIFFGGTILSLLFGASYAVAATPLAILAAGQLFSVVSGPVGLVLKMSGFEFDAALGAILAIAVNIGLDFLLVPQFGTEGAAIATATSLCVANISMLVAMKKRLGFVTVPFG
ncbi:flippase [Methyloligella sp. 2.7D]|uniref:flippase n=1 Tax=unclassified Methyloligella TaxID=2625955 RepID=UPI00157D9538|nr:flippase [Methyloligella sp. GL2]QKP78202.1 flippase [Methyloligella sp. GL2]